MKPLRGRLGRTAARAAATTILAALLLAPHAARAQDDRPVVVYDPPAAPARPQPQAQPQSQSQSQAQTQTPSQPQPQTPSQTQATPAATPGATRRAGRSPAGGAQTTPAPQRPAAAQRPARAAAAPLAGRVVGDGGEPLAGVAVYAGTRSPGGPRSPQNVLTDETGAFVFPALEPGLYLVNATVPGYIPELDPMTGRPANTFRPGDNATLRLVKGGVVTGAVTDQYGEPVVGLTVRALRVRELDGGLPPTPFPFTAEDRTDDRGVYRVYGLQSGMYVVYTGGSSSVFGPVSAYGGDAPTFFPSGTRDTASEVAVRAGQETAGIDIRYREEQGRRVTGAVVLPAGAAAAPGAGEPGAGIILTYAASGMQAGNAFVNVGSSPERSFSIEGVGDGEYEIQAQTAGREGVTAASARQRVSVRGGDVTGLRLTLTPLGALSGSLRVEPAAAEDLAREPCKAARAAQTPQETLVIATPERARDAAPRPLSRADAPRETTPDPSGDFALRSLEPARYRLSVRLFDDALYVRSVQLPGPPAAAKAAASPASSTSASSPAGATFELKSGQQLAGVVVRVAEGAAALSGRVAPAEGASPQTPPPTRVHLVPQERERAEDTLRYHEAAPSADGSFSFRNVAPGRYFLLARAEADAPDARRRPAALDADTRARLRREAETAAAPVELQPCQRTPDFVLTYPQTK